MTVMKWFMFVKKSSNHLIYKLSSIFPAIRNCCEFQQTGPTLKRAHTIMTTKYRVLINILR